MSRKPIGEDGISLIQHLPAYQASFAFLEALAIATGSDYWEVILGSMQLLADGRPIDPAVAAEWSRAVDDVMGATGRECTDADAFQICAAWLGDLYRSTGAVELAAVLTDMTGGATGQIPGHLNEQWRRCCDRARSGDVDVWLRLMRPVGHDDSTAR